MLEAQGNSRNRARSQTPIPRDPGVPCSYPSTQALPESEFQHIPDQPEYGTPQALCFLIPSVLGMGWALPEGIRGSSLTQDLEGDFGAVLRPVSGMLQGSGTPEGRTLIRWTEMSKVSSSLLARVGRQKDKMSG